VAEHDGDTPPPLDASFDDDLLLGDAPDPTAGRTWSSTTRAVVVALCVARYVIPVVALGYAARVLTADPIDPDEVVLLTLVRPAKEVLLLAGGLVRTTGAPNVLVVFLAYVPLMIVAVWPFFLLGRILGPSLTDGSRTGFLARAVPPDTLRLMQKVLARRGPAVAILARIAALPPTVLAAAAGTSPVNAVRYLLADAVGGIAAFGITIGLGLALGEAYERGGTWVTVGGVVFVFAGIMIMTNWLQREADREDADAAARADGGVPSDSDDA
jgi:membrane protein DedA with SNARE-associated domain